MCSLTLSSLNFEYQASINSPDTILSLANKMREYGVVTELEYFGLGMINYGSYLIKKKLIEGSFYWNLLFGNISGVQANCSQIDTAIKEIPVAHFISLAGLGSNQLTINAASIATRYGVRVSLEDNIWLDHKGGELATNKVLLLRVHQLMSIHLRELFSSKEFGVLQSKKMKRISLVGISENASSILIDLISEI
jgi:uncharacterized protein (DUF849 family)